ncbi:hypothetical protein G1H11_17350 [Phytoactinopolyspora alkaliphila]|uniref:Uncharacterized protein n=1 Tax=Phytoactinopolyspora alkaliphila TaxID=1783498 RepID=A0A6N9YQ13_9ACTN|nr:hypothetical protein [Phytoactinopolyspora alkaliphila]NED97072.1 hypothetical protein [Phytoactinopolyspora alkaliphila]
MKYGTAPAFRRPLEDRLTIRAGGDGARIARDRKRVVFDRFRSVGRCLRDYGL